MVGSLEMGFRLPRPSGTVIRKPDLGVVRSDSPQPLLPLIEPEDGVIASRVLPGLRLRLSDLNDEPTPKAMRADPVYADFMPPAGWRRSAGPRPSRSRA
jgi:hypothetical protein